MTRRPEAYDGPGEAVGGDVARPVAPWPGRSTASTWRTTWCTRSTTPTSSARTPSAAHGVRPRPRPSRRAADRLPGRARRRGRRPLRPPALAPRGRGPARRGRRPGHRAARRRSWSARGGISWELTRQLVKNLPAMVVPKWVSTRTQPIAVDDVVRYLVGGRSSERGARPGLRDRRPRAADLPRDARGGRRGLDRAPRCRSSRCRC